jgi:hypothetical protein
MIALYDGFLPRFCPACGEPTRLDREPTQSERQHGITVAGDYYASAAHCCPCGLLYSQASEEELVAAADASGSDLRRFVEAA